MALKTNATHLTPVKNGKKNQLFFTRRVNKIRDTSCFKNVHSEYKPCNALSQASQLLTGIIRTPQYLATDRVQESVLLL